MAVAAEIWEGDDYLPYVWDRWFWRDPGLLAVAERGGRVVGMGHLLDMGYGEWWLQGLRVEPASQGQGIGAHLHRYFVDRWLHTGGDVVRLATHKHRLAVQHLCDETGFTRIGSVVLATASSLDGGSELEPMEEVEPDAVFERLRVSDLSAALGGLLDLGWRFAAIRPERLADSELKTLRHRPTGSLVVYRLAGEGDTEAHVLAIEAALPEMTDVLASARRWAANQGLGRLIWLAPTVGEFTVRAEAAGYELQEDDTLFVYERRR
jgi:GNAT superfamily N-acetyltransferase